MGITDRSVEERREEMNTRKRPGTGRALWLAPALLLVAALAFGGGKGEKTAAAAGATPEKNLPISLGMTCPDPNADEMGKWLQEKFAVTIKIVNTEGDKLKLLATAGDLPDAFGAVLGDAFFNQLKMDELIRAIPDAAIDRYPNVKKYLGVNEAVQAFKALSGKYYMINRESDAENPPKAVQMPFLYRADWLKKLNLAVPKTTAEFYDVLKAFTNNDPDGNGKNDTFGLTGWLWQMHFIPWVDMYSWIKEDGKWIPGYVSKNMVDALVFYSRLYKDKILDPEFAVAKARDMFFTSKVGMICANSGLYWLWNNITVGFAQANQGVNAMEAVKILAPLSKDTASPAVWPRAMNTGGTAFSAKCNDEKLERILRFFEWSLSPEGRDFSKYGFLNKDYIVKDGKAVSILPNKETEYNKQKPLWEVYPSVNLFNLVRWDVVAPTELLNPIYPKAIIALEKETTAMLSKNLAPVNILIESLSTPARDKFNVGLDAIETEFGRIISSPNPADDYAVYRKKLLEVNGLQAVIDEMNAAIVKQGLDKIR
jgi:putative aldouronate transport system substrate-binding protein